MNLLSIRNTNLIADSVLFESFYLVLSLLWSLFVCFSSEISRYISPHLDNSADSCPFGCNGVRYFVMQHRTGCLVGCLRKLQNWCLSSVVEEYKHFAGIKWRETDLRYLETYDVSCIKHCLESIIYMYYGSRTRRLLYGDENLQKPQMTYVL